MALPAQPVQRPPLPPQELSLRAYVEDQWNRILIMWRRGWAASRALASLQQSIDAQRLEVFDPKFNDARYDWQQDWHQANNVHQYNLDYVSNRAQHIDELKKLWFDWSEKNYGFLANVSLEALRSMVLVNGAAIIAALTVLSGQITEPSQSALIVSKLTVFTSVLSLILMAIGHSVLFIKMDSATSYIRGRITGPMRHSKLFAVNRFLRRYLEKPLQIANGLIFGSIAVFGLSAFISAVILLVS